MISYAVINYNPISSGMGKEVLQKVHNAALMDKISYVSHLLMIIKFFVISINFFPKILIRLLKYPFKLKVSAINQKPDFLNQLLMSASLPHSD